MTEPKITREQFDTWEAFIAAAQEPARWETASQCYAHAHAKAKHRGTWEGVEWHGTETWEQATQFARYGWPEGRARMTDAIAVVAPERQSIASRGRDVAGEYPLVHLAIAGDPMCMHVTRRAAVHGTPVVRIDYGCNVGAFVSGDAVLNRGAALLSIVDRLEERGYSTEVRIVMQNKSMGDNPQVYTTTVTFKHAGDALDIDLAAFAMTNPSVQRRFNFALMESKPEMEKAFVSGHGRSLYAPVDEDAIYVRGAEHADSDPTEARRRMEELFAEYLEG